MEFLELFTSLVAKAASWNSIGIQLGLSPDELDTIKSNSQDVQECLRRVLQKWYDRTPNPTWKEVITALRSPLLGEMKLAKDLEDKMVISVKSEADDDHHDSSVEILKQFQAKIKGSFATLVRKVTEKLERGDLNMKGFHLYMVNLFPPGDVIDDSVTVTDIFEAISRHRLWDYSCCALIEEIANEFGGNDFELKGWINVYKSELSGFRATTKIVDYIKVCEDEEEIADSGQRLNIAQYDRRYFRKLTVKLKSRVTASSLEYIDHFWQSIADHFILPSLSVLLDSIQEGCVEVTWLVPVLSAIQIQTNIQDSAAFLQEREVMRVIMDDEILYDEEGLDMKLLNACKKGDVDEALALLTYGVDVDTVCTQEKVTPLLVSAQEGNFDIIELLLTYHATINQQDIDGYTPLILAALYGNLSAVQILLEHTADTTVITKDGWSALSSACFVGHLEVARVLLKHGALPDAHVLLKDGSGSWTALSSACCKGHLKVVRVLLEHGASPNAYKKGDWTPLMYAIDKKEENLSTVEILLDAAAVINYTTPDSWSALSLACDNGHINIVQLLISKGADVNICREEVQGENCRWTPLVAAASGGHYKICQLLLSNGAVVDLPWEGDGATPLIMACTQNYVEVVKLMLEHGANVHARCKNGALPIHTGCQGGHLDTVKVLQTYGASLDAISENGFTPLTSACTGDNVDVVGHLLEQKPSLLNMQTRSGWSPLMIACDGGHSTVVAKLLSHGADVELCTQLSGLSALMMAANKGHVEAVKLLLEAKAPVNYTDKSSGWTALFLAAKNGYLAIAKVLVEHGADLTLKAQGVTAYDVASIHNQNEVCAELEAQGYQSLAPPTEHMKREVERFNMDLTRNFLDIENIRTFREVLRQGGGSGVSRKPGSSAHPSLGIGHVDT